MLETNRLILRQWRDDDYSIYKKLVSDPDVMRYFPAMLSEQECYSQIERLKNIIAVRGWGSWAVELKHSGEFIGFVGLHEQDAQSGIPHAPLIEIGWRLLSQYWGEGYATEAAKRALKFSFDELQLSEVYSYTTLANKQSQKVMIRIGMKKTGEEFIHPSFERRPDLERHTLYRITRDQWIKIN
ncbi:MAG: family N-acetyltransferase [Pseudomonadota bacterium]|nr:family N-acetyltransferase [Pseudomonadota bacterium]PLY35558.1 GNAT family N-acetyltransferase [Pectobacterium carotovorum]